MLTSLKTLPNCYFRKIRSGCFPDRNKTSKMHAILIIFLLNAVLAAENPSSQQKKPNIIFIYADDMGWNDVSFNGSPQIPTPNIDALASSGVILNNYYGEYLCTPSRAALLSGKYPIRLGLQNCIILHGTPSALPLDVVTLPQHLKNLGYNTHMVGKWHLGYMTKECTPISKGFDTFFGYYNSEIDYYDYTAFQPTPMPEFPAFFGIDLHNGATLVKDVRGQYATELFTEKAIDIIRNHNSSEPLFLYLAHLAVHNGLHFNPLQAPPEQVNKFGHIKDEKRKIFAGMVSALDDSVGAVFEALNQTDFFQNTIIAFVSDNGGDSNPKRSGFSSNHPLRGMKFTFWEGGVRVPAVLWSPLLQLKEPRVSTQLMHVTDWLPTFYSVAGGDVEKLGDIDGHDMWDAIVKNEPSPRQELLHGINHVRGMHALRKGDLKVITGNCTASPMDPWYDPAHTKTLEQPDSMDDWVFRNGSIVRDILEKSGRYLPKEPDSWRTKAKVNCSRVYCKRNECDPLKKPCLFNITHDPCEQNNLASQYPEVVVSMLKTLRGYEKFAVEPQTQTQDPHADPRCHGFGFVPWLDPDNLSNCPLQ